MREAIEFFIDASGLDLTNLTWSTVMVLKLEVTVALGIFAGVMGVLKAIIVELLRARNL
jgi:hypothetical protein